MSEELSAAEVDELRLALEAARREAEGLLELSREGEKPVAVDTSIGRLTRMDALQQQSMTQATRAASELRSRQVAAALGRIAAGTYGACLGCDKPIGVARLRVRPEATLCVRCQSAREGRS